MGLSSELSRFTFLCLSVALLASAKGESLAEPIFSFAIPSSAPLGELVQAADQSFYGTASGGGASGAGAVFKLGADGVLKTAAEFTGFTGTLRGAQPASQLVLGGDGNYYGVNAQGGTEGLGTIFKVTPEGTSVTVVVFTGDGQVARGSFPYAALLAGGDGFLYGTTSRGGAFDLGTVFKLSEADGTLTTLTDFGGTRRGFKGANPYAALVRGSDGLLYGTTAKGGATNHGTIFSISTAGVLKTLVEFTDRGPRNKGAAPYGALTPADGGVFYGTTARGGAGDYGTIFRVNAAGTLATLVELTGRAGRYRGGLPEATLVVGLDANLYGTAYSGGTYNLGTVFKVTPAGLFTPLVDFTGNKEQNRGAQPQSGLTLGQDGNLYGTTLRGGSTNSGTLFRMTAAGVLTTLTDFAGVNPVAYSQGGIVRARDGNFYGVTQAGGLLGKGAVFRITPSGVIKTLAEFTGQSGATIGEAPAASLLQGRDGAFYGTTLKGGTADKGTIFRITAAGALTTLVEFTGNGATNKGASPRAALIQTSTGDFYGTTYEGGAANAGTIFRLGADGTLTTLVEFTGHGATNKGAAPTSALLLGSDLRFHGTTEKGGAKGYGTIFSMSPEGELRTEVEFADDPAGIKGAFPEAALIEAPDHNFYGTTATGGATGDGTVFKVSPAGVLTTLLEFTGRRGRNKGTGPTGALFAASDGLLYGTTGFGGTMDFGTAFRMTTDGTLTTVAELDARIGAYPEVGFVEGSDGNLYATASLGGVSGAGSVFRLRLRAATDTIEAVAVTPGSAQLRARLIEGSFSGTVHFEFGTSDYDHFTPEQTVASGTASAIFSASLTGLQPNTVYFYRIAVTDSSGTVYGHDESFVTPPAVTAVLAQGDTVELEPETTVISSLGIPSIADNLSVAVLANLTTATGRDTAILAGNPPVVIARKGTPAPLSGSALTAVFTTFKDPVSDAAGHVAFAAGIQFQNRLPGSGLWTNAGGTLAEVARAGGDVPGVTGGRFAALSSYAMSQAGVVFFTGTIAGGGATAATNLGLWAVDSSGGKHLLIRKGDTITGAKIVAIAALAPVTGSTGQGRAYYGQSITARVTLSDRRQAIVQLSPGTDATVIGPTPFALSADTPTPIVKTIGIPSISTGGAAAFLATLSDSKQAIVASGEGGVWEIAAQAGTPAAGADDATFASFADPVYNQQLQTAFLANLAGPGATAATRRGLWWHTSNGLSLVARSGSPVLTIPEAKWGSFLSLALPDNANPVFLATLAAASGGPGLPSDVTKANQLGLFSVDANNARRLLVRTGDRLQVRGTTKTLSLLTILGAVPGSPGQARSYNAAGDLIFRATFTDHTQAVMRIHLP